MLTHRGPSRVRAWLAAIAGIGAALLGGCSAMVREEHYFATYAKSDPLHEPKNFFRLQITGGATFSNARYIAGFYDPRAVDLFFNELKPQSSDRTLFSANLQLPGESTVLTPLSPGDRGTYVMVLSTNADAIADAIGNFSESQVVANSIARLVNRDKLREKGISDANVPGNKAAAAAATSEIKALLTEAYAAGDQAAAEAKYLITLNAIGRQLGAPSDFRTVADFSTWLNVRRAQK